MDNYLYKQADKLKALVYRKEQFENVLADMRTLEYEKGTISLNIVSSYGERKYNGKAILFSDNYMEDYLKGEISHINSEINKLISSLQMEVKS